MYSKFQENPQMREENLQILKICTPPLTSYPMKGHYFHVRSCLARGAGQAAHARQTRGLEKSLQRFSFYST